MTQHLLAISIGPVQGFIAAARRTRDLWCGSQLLSKISKAAAITIAKSDGKLIFPALDKGARELEPGSDFNVANIILAELPEGIDPSGVSRKAEDAAQCRWRELAEKAKEEAKDFIVPGRWELQVEDVMEFYSSWCPLEPAKYAEARRRVMRLMAGRKALRDFMSEKSVNRVPKSSLDGARDTLWREDYQERLSRNKQLTRRLRLGGGEQLDAVGLTKRLAFGRTPYPSVSRIAADPWLRGLKAEAERDTEVNKLFGQFKDQCQGLMEYGLTRVSEKLFPEFPYEGTAIYRNRHRQLKEEMGKDESAVPRINELTCLATNLIKKRGLGEPDPYLAVLVADGDRMGKIISHIDSSDKHKKFSGELAKFAGAALKIVEGQNGTLVYAGGDDVLAFVPVDKCLTCAQGLHKSFSDLLGDFPTPEGKPPTLSVGIAIGHFMESLGEPLGIWPDGGKSRQTSRSRRLGNPRLHKRSLSRRNTGSMEARRGYRASQPLERSSS